MKTGKRLFSALLSLILAVSLLAVPVSAVNAAETDPAPVKQTYVFDGVEYRNVGNGNFAESQSDYYMSMLSNVIGSYSDDGSKNYSVADLWTLLGWDIIVHNDADAFKNNLFKYEAGYFENEEIEEIIFKPLGAESSEYIFEDKHNFEDLYSAWSSTHDIDLRFFKAPLMAAANSQEFARKVAKTAASNVIGSDGEAPQADGSVTVSVDKDNAPELNGPVYYTFVGAAGKDLHLYSKSPYNEKYFHGMVAAFSDFSITPIIPDENAEAPYAYVTTSVGTPSQNEQKVVSDVKNYSGETVTASQSISESTSTTVTSTIDGSRSTSTTDGYSISDTVKVGAKFTLEKIFEVGGEGSTTTTTDHSVTDTVTSGWSKSEGTTDSKSESRTISISLPPYTTALMSQQQYNSEALTRYNCPAALNFKATIYYVCGETNDGGSQADISFHKLTDFGSTSDSRTDLAKRYKQSTGSASMADADGIQWNDLSHEIYADALAVLAPFDSTPATFSGKISKVKTEVEDILPIYTIDAIKFVNPDGVLYNKPWLTEINMEVGDTDNSDNYSLRALNQYGADFYTFYKQNGSFYLLDESGNDITETGNDVIKPDRDAVTGAVRFKAVGEGTVYLRYKIKNGLYKTADMAASNTPEDYIDDSEIAHPALLRINVTDNGHKHTWLRPRYTWSDDYSTCTAYCRCKYDDAHIMQEASDTESKVVRKGSCTQGEIVEYSAAFETEGFEPQTVTVTKAAPGHKWDAGKVTKKATTTQTGTRVYTCSVCGDTKTETIAKLAKKANPLTVKGKTVKIKYKKLKKKAQTLAATKVIRFTKKTNDKKTYTLVSAKKGSKSFKKYFKISKKTGKVTIKKNRKMKKGIYKVRVKVKALGNANYKASAWKTVTFKVRVK